eukprot:GILI01009183.1.p1 GENE.GILI01009183.1~~GILI01009183.1.p1  ORF type:complete len:396 (+),score=87.75 GILI01009183.1:162-1349(+)
MFYNNSHHLLQQQQLLAQQQQLALAQQQQHMSPMSMMNGTGQMSPNGVHSGAGSASSIAAPTLAANTPLPSLSKSSIIRDVWAENLEEEFALIRELVVDYPYVAMDTEFPGVVAKPVGSYKHPYEFYYATLRYNVNLLKIIQLGISLLNEKGEVPEGCCTWQFNFRFNLAEDTFAQDSIELLKTGGINFDHFCEYGIEITRFSELLYSSGLVLNPEVRWLAFHAGYDFGYLIRGLLNRDLPDKDEDFNVIFHQLFPSVFDIKFVLRQTDIMHSAGLDFLADSLSVRRLGTAHQAGSDSLLTGHSFFKLLRDRLNRQMPYHANGILYGLREDAAASNGAMAHNGASGMTPSTPPTATPYTPGGTAAGQFPSTPLMNIVLHGGSRDSKIHTSSHGNK